MEKISPILEILTGANRATNGAISPVFGKSLVLRVVDGIFGLGAFGDSC